MRRFEYAVLRTWRLEISGRKMYTFFGWVLTKDQNHDLTFSKISSDEKWNDIYVELVNRQKAWDEKWKGQRAPDIDTEEFLEEKKEQNKLWNKADKRALKYAHEVILAKKESLFVATDVLDLLNKAGDEGWETTGKLPGSQSQGNFGLTMMRRLIK